MAFAAALIAAKRLDKVNGRLTFEPKDNNEEGKLFITPLTYDMLKDSALAAVDLAECLYSVWDDLEPNKSGLKTRKDEVLFYDEGDGETSCMQGIELALNEISDTLMSATEKDVCISE